MPAGNNRRWLIVAVVGLLWPRLLSGQTLIVEKGEPRAEIVIADPPPRSVKLAAAELKQYLAKISGATLPIVHQASAGVPVQIYVGRSARTDELKISDADLPHGAFRILADKNSLVLLGRDRDFIPKEPWARNHPDQARMLKKWDEIVSAQFPGSKWGNPVGASMQRRYSKQLGLWDEDERGSLNAVYEYLRGLGVRWYMPGELGEIVPKVSTIALEPSDRVVRPDFALRYFHLAPFFWEGKDDILWMLRLGLNHGAEVVGLGEVGHGTANVHSRDEVKREHPEYFALWGSKRITDQFNGKPCLSSTGLFEENVKYVRAMFDVYDEQAVSVMPEDGYSFACGCELCQGKSTPQRGRDGQISDYVWDYVNRVAVEVNKSHPDRKVTCFAYGTYTLPPEKIEKLSPNLVVGIVQPRRFFQDRAKRQEFVELREAWRKKLASGQMLIWDHYPFTAPGKAYEGLPAYFPHLISEDLRSLKGLSSGEVIEVMFDPQRNMGLHAPGFNHLNMYVTARLYWDAEADVDKLLAEYYQAFYGPAAAEMKAYIEYCEKHYSLMRTQAEPIEEGMRLLTAARQAAGDSDYGRRIELLVEFVKPLRGLREQLSKGRENVPEARIRERPRADVAIDGKLDEPAWQEQQKFGLREIETGKAPTQTTSFRAFWSASALYLAIECREPPGQKPKIGTTQHDDDALWSGDCIELLLETQSRSYYQLAFSPTGALVDLDRKDGLTFPWESGVTAATQLTDAGWTLEARIPIAGENQADIEPLSGIAGGRPSPNYPWYFNLCRQRVTDGGNELSAFAPTGTANFHVIKKFGKMYVW